MPRNKYKTYINDDGKEEEFCVFIIHGKSKQWREISSYIRNELKFNTFVSITEFGGGDILQKIKNTIWFRCDCAVAILTPDDTLDTGEFNARPNVIFELGYCMGFWDHYYWNDIKLEPVIIIKEERVQLNSDLKGIELILYKGEKIETTKRKLKQGLNGIYKYLKKKYAKG